MLDLTLLCSPGLFHNGKVLLLCAIRFCLNLPVHVNATRTSLPLAPTRVLCHRIIVAPFNLVIQPHFF